MVLPEELKQAFRVDLEQLEQEQQMPYITSIEQTAKAEGKLEERQAIALKMLQENILVETIARLTELSTEQIEQLRSQSQAP
jgi:restriction endonuclease Mrr